jgi:tRNA (guanine37-N1)-methyltransferase
LRKTHALTVPIAEAERAIRTIRSLRLNDGTLKLSRTSEIVFIPLVSELSTEEISKVKAQYADAQFTQALFEEIVMRPRNLTDSLRGKIPEALLPGLPRSYDIIGEIGIVELFGELTRFSSIIGEGIMEINPHLRLVLRRSGQVSGTFRIREYATIAGEGDTETVHEEFSCLFRLDVTKVYFNPRLSHERMRVARQIKEGESVLDMFAGVGPYSILVAKTQRNSQIYSADINPGAFSYLKHNILLNRVADQVIPFLGDARQLTEANFRGKMSRVIMNLPSESNRFLLAAVQALKEEGGTVHYYTFSSRNDDLDQIRKSVRSMIERCGRTVDSFAFSDTIKEVAPNRVQIGMDIVVK